MITPLMDCSVNNMLMKLGPHDLDWMRSYTLFCYLTLSCKRVIA